MPTIPDAIPYRKVAATAAAALLLASLCGCVRNPGDTQGELRKYSGPVKVKTLDQTQNEHDSSISIVPVEKIHNTEYAALDDVATAIGFRDQWLQGGQYGIGDNDARWTFRPGESAVQSGDRTIRMPAPAVKRSNRLYAPVSGLESVFGSVTSFRSFDGHLSFLPKTRPGAARADAQEAPFRDAPRGAGGLRIQSTGGENRNDKYAPMIEEAKKYLGVRYDFGAAPYRESHTFDCSSFVQFLFAPYGIDMPRTADSQSKRGSAVSRDELETGDLLFFVVPGRFKDDTTVGHVGIYMGDGNMIHSSPAPDDGVQITDINKSYWKDHFLFAKRVLP